MIYIPQTECPKLGNKYYNTVAKGGYSTCVQGNTKTGCYNEQLNVLPNCVGFAGGRFNEVVGENKFKYPLNCNAEDFYARAQKKNLAVGSTPKLGAIMVWAKGKAGVSSDGAGHVAIVEKVISNKEVITSESGWEAKKLFWTQNRKLGSNKNWGQAAGYTFLGFIYNPAVTDDTVPRLSRGDSGIYVKSVQEKLVKAGKQIAVDGLFGAETLNAIKEIQKEYKLTVDGIIGEKTYAALDKACEPKKPDGVTDLAFKLDSKSVTAWATNIDGQNYIRMIDLQNLGIVKSVTWNSTKKQVEVKTK